MVTISWLLLALIHVPPALVFVWPELCQQLYGVEAESTTGVLLTHRGILFAGVALAAFWASRVQEVRPLASLVVGLSVAGFLITYGRAGLPQGALVRIAKTDLFALLPLTIVVYDSWIKHR